MAEAPDLVFNDGEWYKDRPDITKARCKNAHVLKSLEVLFELGHRAILAGRPIVFIRYFWPDPSLSLQNC